MVKQVWRSIPRFNMAIIFAAALRLPLFSAVSSAAIALAATNQSVLYPIDVGQRGTEIVNTFTTLLSHAAGVTTPEVAIQTNLPGSLSSSYLTYRYISNGIIPYIQNIATTTFNTLLIVSYYTQQYQSSIQYVVLPVEYVSSLLSFPNYQNLPSPGMFVTTYPANTIPFFTVDPRKRGADILSAFTQLKGSLYATSTSQVWIQTGLSGPFNPYPQDFSNLLKNVLSIEESIDSTGGTTYLHIRFQPPGRNEQKIVLAPEQIQQIIYILNPQTP